MRSEKQRQASRTNGAKSKGPKSPEGKAVSSMNGLKHGLRAAQVVLPGEDAAEFHAELEGWAGDWKPSCHTGAILVERAAVASWRLRRCVRAEKDLLIEIAARGKDEPEGDDEVDVEAMDRIDEADEWLSFQPQRCLAVLRSLPGGVDRLIWRWEKLDEALADGPDAWDRRAHEGLMPLLGHVYDSDPAAAGPLAEASHRLFRDGRRRVEEDKPEGLMTDGEIDEVIEELRGAVAGEIKTLKALRKGLLAPAERAEAVADAKFTGVTPELMLMHRYEMAHERSLRAAIKDLVALEKARPELGRVADVVTEVMSHTDVATTQPEPSARPAAGPGPMTPAAPTEPETPAVPAASGRSRRRRGGRARASGGAGGGRSKA